MGWGAGSLKWSAVCGSHDGAPRLHLASSSLSPWVGLAVFCTYAVVALVLAGIALRRRDA